MSKIETTRPKETDLTKSLSRALRVLNAIADAGKPLGVTEIARRIDVHKSSVYRLLRTMVEYNYLEQHESTSEYWLGAQLSSLGQLAALHLELPKLARVHVERLSRRTQETANLVKLSGDRCLYLISVQTEHSIGMIARPIGSSDELHCTAVGKAMLAYLPIRRAENLLYRTQMKQRTPATPRTPDDVLAQLDSIRANGFSIDNGENDENVRCIGSAVFDRRGDVVGAVSISGPDFRVTDSFINQMAPAVVESAIDISTAIGLPREENPLYSTFALSPTPRQDHPASH